MCAKPSLAGPDLLHGDSCQLDRVVQRLAINREDRQSLAAVQSIETDFQRVSTRRGISRQWDGVAIDDDLTWRPGGGRRLSAVRLAIDLAPDEVTGRCIEGLPQQVSKDLVADRQRLVGLPVQCQRQCAAGVNCLRREIVAQQTGRRPQAQV